MVILINDKPRDNIFEYRLNDLKSLETKICKSMSMFGYELTNYYYDNEDPTEPSFTKILEFSNGNDITTLSIPATPNFLIDANLYAPVFQVVDNIIFRTSDGIYIGNSYLRWLITIDLSHVIYKAKHRIPMLLYFMEFEDDIEAIFEKLNITNAKIVNTTRIKNAKYKVKIKPHVWIVVEEDSGKLTDALFKPFNTDNKKMVQFFNKITEDTYTNRKYVSTYSGIRHITDNIAKVVHVKDYTINGYENGISFLDIMYKLYQNNIPQFVEVNNFSRRRLRLSEWILDDFTQQIIQKFVLKHSKARLYNNAIRRLLLKDSRKTLLTPINPIDELSTYSRCSFIGRGGIEKESITVSMRNIHPSYYGNIDPIDTPAGKKIGVSQYIVPIAKIDKYGSFMENNETSDILSVATELIPFLQYNDSTRIQMAASQMRQAIALNEPDHPYILSGYESHYLEYTTMLKQAKTDGQVIYRDENILLIHYNDNTMDVIDTSINEHDGFDVTLYQNVKGLVPVKKGQILATTKHIDPKTGSLTLGKNLLAGFISYGWNFEDAIVISESAARKLATKYITHEKLVVNGVLLSLNDNDYQPILPNGTYVRKGQPILKYTQEGFNNVTDLFTHATIVEAPVNGRIYYKVIPLKKYQHYDYIPMMNWISKTCEIQSNKKQFLFNLINETGIDEKEKEYVYMLLKSQYRSKRLGAMLVVEYYIVEDKLAKVGSKLANRHGNKGVISIILPDEEMPYIPRLKQHLDVVLNPLGVISRMNLGQLFELHLTNAIQTFLNNSKTKTNNEFLTDILNFLIVIDNTKNRYISTLRDNIMKMPKKIREEIAEEIRQNGIYTLQPPFESCTIDQLKRAMQIAGTSYIEPVEIPQLYTKKKLKTNAAIGYNYFFRLVHEPYKKIFGRSIGEYGKFEQPSSGSNAHRLGEMEVWTLIAYDAPNLIKEFLSIKADNPDERYELFNMLYHSSTASYYKYSSLKTETASVLTHLLKVCGIDIEF